VLLAFWFVSLTVACFFSLCQVENKVKAKKQAEHRVAQQANQAHQAKQRQDRKETEKIEPKKNVKSRGSLQREKKRKQRESGDGEEDVDALKKQAYIAAKRELKLQRAEEKEAAKKVKPIKPPKKKKKVDKEDESFDKLVDSYRAGFQEEPKAINARAAVEEKRWFE
jgi:hypothetical protein